MRNNDFAAPKIGYRAKPWLSQMDDSGKFTQLRVATHSKECYKHWINSNGFHAGLKNEAGFLPLNGYRRKVHRAQNRKFWGKSLYKDVMEES